MSRTPYEADGELAQLLACYGVTVPPHLGTELYNAIVRRLEYRQLSVGLAPEVFRQKLIYAVRWLEDNDAKSVRNVESWLRQIYETPLRSLYSFQDGGRLAS